jgi:hypothetical protein
LSVANFQNKCNIVKRNRDLLIYFCYEKFDMQPVNLFIAILITSVIISCKKDTTTQEIIPVPNGDFELWDDMPNLLFWQTNSCPVCDPPWETYIVQKVTDASNGIFAAKLIYNNVYSSFAKNKFSISLHPTLLSGYIKSTITNGDTAIIHIDLFSGNNIVDNGNWYETSSTINYTKIEIPISQNSSSVDSALIRIVGGKKQNTELYVDNFVLIKTTN